MNRIIGIIIIFRGLLERNKIFFEVIVASTLSFMAIYVSIKSNEISKAQTLIMELENTPNIEIRESQVYNDSLKIYDITKWYVFNNNSKISNFKVNEEVSFIQFIVRESYDTILIPLKGYLNRGGNLYGTSEGLVFDFDNKYTGYSEFITRNKLWQKGYLEIESFIEISYKTVLGKVETRKFQVSPSINEISEKEWRLRKVYWENNLNQSIYLERDSNKNAEAILKHPVVHWRVNS